MRQKQPTDKIPDVSDNPVTRPGDIWLLGKHRLLCGDAVNEADVQRLMDCQTADMIFTDPPYNVNYGGQIIDRHRNRKIINDNLSNEDWEMFCKKLFENFKKYNKGDIYMWGASGPNGMKMRLWLVEIGCHWSATIIWSKQHFVFGPAKYQRMYEPCFYGWFDKSSFVGDRKQTDVWNFNRPIVSDLHPTMKPVDLCAYAIKNSSLPGQIVLDLFLGSGSTLIACEQVDRICYGMELDPAYCDVIVRRWEDYTWQKAMRIGCSNETPMATPVKRQQRTLAEVIPID
jgi:DNA modification methylase